jgi:hypothetical protein
MEGDTGVVLSFVFVDRETTRTPHSGAGTCSSAAAVAQHYSISPTPAYVFPVLHALASRRELKASSKGDVTLTCNDGDSGGRECFRNYGNYGDMEFGELPGNYGDMELRGHDTQFPISPFHRRAHPHSKREDGYRIHALRRRSAPEIGSSPRIAAVGAARQPRAARLRTTETTVTETTMTVHLISGS